jgi:probable HAF family extracellular repeat protein
MFFGIFATGLNDYGQVVGVSDTTDDQSFHAFLWQGGTSPIYYHCQAMRSATPSLSATRAWCLDSP